MALEDMFDQSDVRELERAFDAIEREHAKPKPFDWEVELEDLGW